ncbi:MAG: MFS transporter, partial [Sphingomonas sp.]
MTATTTPDHPALNRKAVGAVVLGNALEFYDFTLYAFFAVPIGAAFFPSDNATDSLLASLALFGIGYVMRPIGGIVIGAFADRAGRKPAMLITIALMAVGMLMLALAPSYATLGGWAQAIVVAGRLIQGLALGGEVGPSTAYLLEAAPPRHRGFVASWQIASQGCAALFAGIVATGLTIVLGEAAMADWGWRVMFLLGIGVVPVGLVIRSHLPETAGEGEDPAAAASTGAVVVRLLREHGRLLLLTFVVIAASTVSNAIGTNMPVYARATLGLTETVSTAVPIALGLASVVFPLLGGWLADRFGRRPVLIWPRAAIVVLAVPAFWWLAQSPTAASVYAVTFLMSALSSINAAAIIVAIPES